MQLIPQRRGSLEPSPRGPIGRVLSLPCIIGFRFYHLYDICTYCVVGGGWWVVVVGWGGGCWLGGWIKLIYNQLSPQLGWARAWAELGNSS